MRFPASAGVLCRQWSRRVHYSSQGIGACSILQIATPIKLCLPACRRRRQQGGGPGVQLATASRRVPRAVEDSECEALLALPAEKQAEVSGEGGAGARVYDNLLCL